MSIPTFIYPAVLAMVAWFLALVTWVCRHTLIKFDEQNWAKYLFRLIVIQTGILCMLYHWRLNLTVPVSICMGVHACLIPGTVPVFDARNNNASFMLRSGIFLLVIITVLAADLFLCGFQLYQFLIRRD